MSELLALRKARITNSRLMKNNLGILMKIRESEFEMEKLAKQLQRCHEEMTKRGMEIPIACTLQESSSQGEPKSSSNKKEEIGSTKGNKKDTQKNRLNAETIQGSPKKAKAQDVSTAEESLDDSSSDTSSDEEM